MPRRWERGLFLVRRERASRGEKAAEVPSLLPGPSRAPETQQTFQKYLLNVKCKKEKGGVKREEGLNKEDREEVNGRETNIF